MPLLLQNRLAAPRGLRPISLTLSADTNNYNIFTAAGSPTDDVDVTLTINATVIVGSTSTGSYALDVGTGWTPRSRVRIINNGSILGKGGAGGQGGGSNVPVAGGAGGPALSAPRPVEIWNNYYIGGGGGGGGGGSGGGLTTCGTSMAGGAGGGAGQGVTNSAGGAAGVHQIICSVSWSPPTAGSGSTYSSPGSTGTYGYFYYCTGACGDSGLISYGGYGGAGGALGAAGAAGGVCLGTCSDIYGVGAGGAAGACTQGNANIIWAATGNRFGALN